MPQPNSEDLSSLFPDITFLYHKFDVLYTVSWNHHLHCNERRSKHAYSSLYLGISVVTSVSIFRGCYEGACKNLLNIIDRKFSWVTNTTFKGVLLNFQYPLWFFPGMTFMLEWRILFNLQPPTWLISLLKETTRGDTDLVEKLNDGKIKVTATPSAKWFERSKLLGSLLIINLMLFLDLVQLCAVQDLFPRANRWQSKPLKIVDGEKKQKPGVNIIILCLQTLYWVQ